MKVLPRTEFGNPILRKTAKRLTKKEITSANIQSLINNMRHTLTKEKLGVGLAALQVGEDLAIAVIAIRPLPYRPDVKVFDATLINPKVLGTHGTKKPLWEGCISSGSGEAGIFAKVPRHKSVTVKYYDETGKQNTKQFSGLAAQVAQHEVDHLNGVLFVDRVEDTKSYMTFSEYKKMRRNQSRVL